MAQATHPTEDIKAFISTRLVTGAFPDAQAEDVLVLLGGLDADATTAGTVHPELAPGPEPVLVSRSWMNTHR